MTVSAVLLGAGRGLRLNGSPKALLHHRGRTLAWWAVRAVAPWADEIILCLPAEVLDAAAVLDLPGDIRVIAGGERRQDSLERGLAVASGDWVLVHDVARPFAAPALFENVLAQAALTGAAVCAIACGISDGIALAQGDCLVQALPRDCVLKLQTPLAVRRPLLAQALSRLRQRDGEGGSVAEILLAAGIPVGHCAGDAANIKITHATDLARLAPA